MGKERTQVYAVIRVDDFIEGDEAISVTEVLPTVEEAGREVDRLNQLNRDKRSHYFWLATRYDPSGRCVTSAPSG